MALKLSNFDKPSNKKFKKIADYLLYTLPLYSPLIAVLGDEVLSARSALIIVTIINAAVVTLKGLSKFSAEPEPVIPASVPDTSTEVPTNEQK
jgi:hypothetical protein